MTEREFKEVVDRFKTTGMEIATYPSSWQINMTDVDGIIQTYYASTGTAQFRSGSGKFWEVKQKIIRNMPEERFRNICMSGEALTNFKRGEW